MEVGRTGGRVGTGGAVVGNGVGVAAVWRWQAVSKINKRMVKNRACFIGNSLNVGIVLVSGGLQKWGVLQSSQP